MTISKKCFELSSEASECASYTLPTFPAIFDQNMHVLHVSALSPVIQHLLV